MVTSFPKVSSEAACFACWPKACFFSGQSMPLADTFGMLVVQDFEGVAVKDGDDEAGEVS